VTGHVPGGNGEVVRDLGADHIVLCRGVGANPVGSVLSSATCVKVPPLPLLIESMIVMT
jgi:hypothetical protein